MNWSEIQNDWGRMSTLLHAHWPCLTDSDLQTVAGDRGKLARALQTRYLLSGQQTENAICAFEKDVRFPGAVK